MDKKIFAVCLIAIIIACTNIEWSKEAIKAFITGGVASWVVLKFSRKS